MQKVEMAAFATATPIATNCACYGLVCASAGWTLGARWSRRKAAIAWTQPKAMVRELELS